MSPVAMESVLVTLPVAVTKYKKATVGGVGGVWGVMCGVCVYVCVLGVCVYV